MSTLALQIIGDKITLQSAWQEMKQDALMTGTLVEFVNDPVSHDHAVSVQGDIREARKFLEKSRKELKDPVLQLGKRIDAAAKAEDADLEKEEHRVQALVNDFQSLELARARAAENARRLEEERLEAARQAEMRRLQEEEDNQRRMIAFQEEGARRAAKKASNEIEAAAAAELQRQIERQKELADAESLEKQDAINEQFNAASAALPTVEMHRAPDQRVVEDYEVTVNDIWALARAHPACVKIEPRLSEIKAMLKAGVKVAGITFKKTVSSTTTTRRAIDV